MNLNLRGRTAIVTGGARGIGRAIALAFAREGCDIVIGDIDLQAAQIVAEEANAVGARGFPIRADVTADEEVGRMVSETLETLGRLDILVNNAGIL